MNMNQELDELTMVAAARSALSPRAADQQRVRRAVTVALAGTAAGATAVAATGTAARSAMGMAGGWPLKLLLASVAVAAVGGGGYGLGYRAGRREAMSPPVSTIPPAVENAAPSAPTPALLAPVPATAPAPEERPAPVARGAGAAVARVEERRPPGKAKPAPATASRLSPAESLAHEVRALRAVERALRGNQPSLALALLQQLEQAVPDGRLQEERKATSAMARCLAGVVPFGVDLAQDFADAYPRSVYLPRVQQSCLPPGNRKDGQR
ncbi:MAG: hypothetical protein QOI66_1294 [Myxococcales bacterium]|jgi:hypothetical protein|nr:hypothetical protein [Myxococcales bacterium]